MPMYNFTFMFEGLETRMCPINIWAIVMWPRVPAVTILDHELLSYDKLVLEPSYWVTQKFWVD